MRNKDIFYIHSKLIHVFVHISSVQYMYLMFSGALDGLQVLSELLAGLGSARDTRSGLGVLPHSQQFAE